MLFNILINDFVERGEDNITLGRVANSQKTESGFMMTLPDRRTGGGKHTHKITSTWKNITFCI